MRENSSTKMSKRTSRSKSPKTKRRRIPADSSSSDSSTSENESRNKSCTSSSSRHGKIHRQSSPERERRRDKSHSSKKKRKQKRSRSSSSSSSSSSRERKKRKKKKKKKKKEKIKSVKKAVAVNVICESSKPNLLEDVSSEPKSGPQPRIMKPMTKEEWEKQQSVIRRVYDEETGRERIIKGDGEILEEIVSKDRHAAINKAATRGDGQHYAKKMGLL